MFYYNNIEQNIISSSICISKQEYFRTKKTLEIIKKSHDQTLKYHHINIALICHQTVWFHMQMK